jgi:hypothetical protein
MKKLRREKSQINKIRNVNGDKHNKTQRVITEYFENLYSSKLENLDEIDKLLDAYNQPKLN